MLNVKVLFLCLASLAGCLDDNAAPDPEPDRGASTEIKKLEPAIEVERPCPIVADEGPCAVACDPVALRDFIEPNTCSTFRCEGVDGELLLAGGCRLD